jgi:prolyl-tRNA synthetase
VGKSRLAALVEFPSRATRTEPEQDLTVTRYRPGRERHGEAMEHTGMNRDPSARELARQADFASWYEDVIARAELADNGPVHGTMVIRPYGYALWERIRDELDVRIKSCGAQNAYFPLFIPRAYVSRVPAEHAGVSPELAVVTYAGGKQLEDPIVVRFSSETVISEFMAKWVKSYRDLPLLLNQWANVVRWERSPSLFLRTTEFLWQEGHTVHVNQNEARDYARRILHEVYEDLMAKVLAVPVVVGIKTRRQRSGAALNSLTCEAMMGNGMALQLSTSHEGGQTFGRAFKIQYLSRDGRLELAWTTSWGTSTRLIGGLIMVHGDIDGLRIPPAVAPTQIAVLAIDAEVVDAVNTIAAEMRDAGLRVSVDKRTDIAFDQRVADWELKGVPLRVEIDSVSLYEGTAKLARRLARGSNTALPLEGLAARVIRLLEEEQREMLGAARVARDSRIAEVATVDAAIAASASGWAKLPWSAVGEAGEDTLAQSGVTVRCLQRPDGSLPDSDAEPDLVAYVARSY